MFDMLTILICIFFMLLLYSTFEIIKKDNITIDDLDEYDAFIY